MSLGKLWKQADLAKAMEKEWQTYNQNNNPLPHPCFFATLDELLSEILGREVRVR